MDDQRLAWIERWLRGWDEALSDTEFAYESLAIEVAVGMALELLKEVKSLREQTQK